MGTWSLEEFQGGFSFVCLFFQLGKQEKESVERARQKCAVSVTSHLCCEHPLNVLKLNVPVHSKVYNWGRVAHTWPAHLATESRFPNSPGGINISSWKPGHRAVYLVIVNPGATMLEPRSQGCELWWGLFYDAVNYNLFLQKLTLQGSCKMHAQQPFLRRCWASVKCFPSLSY